MTQLIDDKLDEQLEDGPNLNALLVDEGVTYMGDQRVIMTAMIFLIRELTCGWY